MCIWKHGPRLTRHSRRAISSVKYALRWRASGRWESQHEGEQNTSLIFPELQVETEQRMTLPPTGMGLRHMEHINAVLPVMVRCLP